MQPTLIDVAIGLAILGSVLSACHRGLGREMLHTVMFAIMVAFGYIMFRSQATGTSPDDMVFWLVNSMYYIITAYVLTWIMMKVLSPLIIGREMIGMRSRFWAGVLSLAKLMVVVFGLNLWFAVHSPDVHPKRLNVLPPLLRESLLVQLSDKFTEDLYRWLAGKQILDYYKSIDRAPTEEEKRKAELENMLGVSPTELQAPAPTQYQQP